MNATGDAQKKMEAYLGRLRGRLRGMNDAEAREVVEELRSHIVDRASDGEVVTASGVDAALAALGSPEDLANEYMTDSLLARAEASRSPVRILGSLFRWASLSIAGFLVLLGSIVGYFLGGTFILCALLKPFHAQSAGLWVLPDGADDVTYSLRLGFSSVPVGGREVLGWWIVPLGLVVGGALVMSTTLFALWCARQYRRSHVLPRS
jgi:Protein of unknown function (DUF1700)